MGAAGEEILPIIPAPPQVLGRHQVRAAARVDDEQLGSKTDGAGILISLGLPLFRSRHSGNALSIAPAAG
eukprot:2458135-Pyramimonas_sp.AAC.1